MWSLKIHPKAKTSAGAASTWRSSAQGSSGCWIAVKASSAAGKKIKVGMAYDVGGRGDQSFNDSAAAGLDKAKTELGVEVKEAAAVSGENEAAREERLQRQDTAGVNKLDVEAVFFKMAGVVGEPWNSLIDRDGAVSQPQWREFAGFRGGG